MKVTQTSVFIMQITYMQKAESALLVICFRQKLSITVELYCITVSYVPKQQK